jgi:ribosomal protein S18 acetylase RimI-like enzyme
MAPAVSVRAATPADRPFLCSLYVATRAEEFASLGWDGETLEGFLRMQFEVQDRAYRDAHPDAAAAVVLVDGQPAGRLYVDRRADTIHVIDVALLPAYRGRGIGTGLLVDLLAEGEQTGRRVTLSAVRSGRAIGLYQRLGFSVTGGDEIYANLDWAPPPLPGPLAGIS